MKRQLSLAAVLFGGLLVLTTQTASAAAAGDLDSTFGTGGMVITDLGTREDHLYDIALQPDGKIVAVGYKMVGGDFQPVMLRYNADGTADSSFGNGGLVV